MKKIIIASFMVIGFGLNGLAQHHDGPPPMSKEDRKEHRQEMKERMAKRLELSDKQINLINAIDEKYEAREEALHQEFEALRKKRHTLLDAKRAEIKRILTPEQAQKVEEMEKRRGERGPRGPRGRQGRNRMP